MWEWYRGVEVEGVAAEAVVCAVLVWRGRGARVFEREPMSGEAWGVQ